MVTLNVYRAKTNVEKIVGLIAKSKPYPFLLETRFGIHTFGVRFSIDVVILDNTYTVVSTYESMKPNRILVWNPKFSHILELPEGAIQEHKIKKGTKIKLVLK